MKLFLLAFCVGAASAATFGKVVPVRPVAVPVRPVVVPGPARVLPFQASAQAVVQNVEARSGQVYRSEDAAAPILRAESDVRPDGYSYTYETGNGISAEGAGSLKKVDNLDVITAQGSYRYTAPDGTPVVVSYVADENGYQPQSDLLPVGPPIPEAILRSLEYIAQHPPAVQK